MRLRVAKKVIVPGKPRRGNTWYKAYRRLGRAVAASAKRQRAAGIHWDGTAWAARGEP